MTPMTTDTSPATATDVRGNLAAGRANALPARCGSLIVTCWALFTLTLRQHMHGKRWLVIAVLSLLPPALALLIRGTAPDAPPMMLEFLLGLMFIPQLLLPLVALLYAAGIIQDEQEEQTITYLLVRPIPKWALYTVKLLATVTTAIVFTVVLTVLTYAAIFLGADAPVDDIPLRCLKVAAIHSLAVVAYCSLFGLVSLLTKRVLIVGIGYTVLVEGLLANLPFGIRLITVIYYTRLIAFRSMEFLVVLPNGRTENVAADAWQFDLRRDPELLEHPPISTCLVVLLIGSLVCTILAAWLGTTREFHVKTPEKE
jgi:ABC-2 type transport system permease protein